MIPGVVFHPRSTWESSAWPVTGPLDNPADNDTAVIHYTAADDLIDGDPGEYASQIPQYLRNIQYAYAKPKSQGGRGYSIGYLFAVDWLGGVWQLRGWEYQSAANAGHNTHTVPILMLVDGQDAATNEAVVAVRHIIAEAQRRSGRKFAIKGHGQLRVETGIGTPTSCPGGGLQAQVNAGVFSPDLLTTNPPPVNPPTQPPPLPSEGEDVLVNLIQYKSPDYPNPQPAVWAQYSGGYKIWVRDPETLAVLKAVSGITTVAQFDDAWFQAAGPVLPGTPLPYKCDGWGRKIF